MKRIICILPIILIQGCAHHSNKNTEERDAKEIRYDDLIIYEVMGEKGTEKNESIQDIFGKASEDETSELKITEVSEEPQVLEEEKGDIHNLEITEVFPEIILEQTDETIEDIEQPQIDSKEECIATTILDNFKMQFLSKSPPPTNDRESIWWYLEKIHQGEVDPKTMVVVDFIRDETKTYPCPEKCNCKGDEWFECQWIHVPQGQQIPLWKYIAYVIDINTHYWHHDCCGGMQWPPWGLEAWNLGWKQSYLNVMWIYFRYGKTLQKINDEMAKKVSEVETLLKEFAKGVTSVDPGSENTKIADMVARYLVSENYPDAQILYPGPTFEWNGNKYEEGKKYNTLSLSRDWIFYWTREWFVNKGCTELDSPGYTWTFIHAFITLYEFAKNQTIKTYAKMLTDLVLLDSAMDYGAGPWGGVLGRTYAKFIENGHNCNCYWDLFFGSDFPFYGIRSLDIVMGSYRLAPVIEDAGNIQDEPDEYYHINMERSPSLAQVANTGKWNFVTKYYSIGGSPAQDSNWNISFRGNKDSWGRFWINFFPDNPYYSIPGDFSSYLNLGQHLCQFKNSGFIGFWWGGKTYSFGFIGDGSWDETIDGPSGWSFRREGKVMLGYVLSDWNGHAGFEVTIQGNKYKSLSEFRDALLKNKGLSTEPNQIPFFESSEGNRVTCMKTKDLGAPPAETLGDLPLNTDIPYSAVLQSGEQNYKWSFHFPFKRIEVIDYKGNHIVDWDDSGKKMTVEKNGLKCIYDFENLGFDGNGCEPCKK